MTKLEEIENDWLTLEEVAKLEGITRGALKNRIYAGKNHPPFSGRGKSRRFNRNAYYNWKHSQQKFENAS